LTVLLELVILNYAFEIDWKGGHIKVSNIFELRIDRSSAMVIKGTSLSVRLYAVAAKEKCARLSVLSVRQRMS